MKILCTGGTGFIGTNVCLEARSRGHEVVGFDNLVRPLTEENIEVLKKAGVKIVRGDIRNKIDFDKLPWVPDGIVHLAGQCGIPYSLVSPYYDFEVNTLGTLNILEYARLNGKIPVAFASSNKSYSNITNEYPMEERETRYVWSDGRTALAEDIPLDAFGKYARTPYGTSKVSADLYCQEYYQCFGVPTVVNRMSCIYGYYQKGVEDQAWVSWFIRQITDGDGNINIFGTGKQVRDMLFGTDCAKLYVDELEQIDKVKGQAYNIGGGVDNTMSLLEAISCIEELSGKKANLTFLPKRHGDQDIWISDIAKIKNDLGWSPIVSPKEGIKLMMDSKL
jgi:CDP-paratose 2-epimerase